MRPTEWVPVYVTRKNAYGLIATHSFRMWEIWLIKLAIFLNIVGWGAYGLYELVEKVV